MFLTRGGEKDFAAVMVEKMFLVGIKGRGTRWTLGVIRGKDCRPKLLENSSLKQTG
jgi:hypothetical protein